MMLVNEKVCLRAEAQKRCLRAGVEFHPWPTEPMIRKHIDGLLLSRLDGSIHWLTWKERLLSWLGLVDAWTIERDLFYTERPKP